MWSLPVLLLCLFLIPVFAALFILIARRAPLRFRVTAIVGGLLFSLFTTLGEILKGGHSLSSFRAEHIALFALLFAVFSFAVLALFLLLDKCRSRAKPAEKRLFTDSYWFSLAVLLLCWVPVFLAYFPGALSYDSNSELFRYTDQLYSADHGVLYTLILGSLINLGWENISLSAGIAIYASVQLAVMAACVSWGVYWLSRRGVPRLVRMPVLAVFALFPLFSLFAIPPVKDVLCTAMFIPVLTFLFDWTDEALTPALSWVKAVLFVLFGALMILIRINCGALFALLLPFAVVLAPRARGAKWKSALLLCLVLAIGLGGTYALNTVTEAEPSDPANLFSMPLQQIGRAARCDDLTEDQLAVLDEILYDRGDEESWEEESWEEETEEEAESEELPEIHPTLAFIRSKYDETISDPMKNAMDSENFSSDPARYIAVWAEIGRSHPLEYTEAFLVQNLPYYSFAERMRGWDIGMGFNTGGLEDVERDSRLPFLLNLLEPYRRDASLFGLEAARVLSMPVLPIWICLFMLLFAIARKENPLPSLFCVIQWVLMLFAPVALNRYVLMLYYAVPLLIAMALRKQTQAVPGRESL